MTEETFEVEIDTHKPWHTRRELFDALTPKTKAEIVEAWKESGMQLPTEAEIERLPLEQKRELMGVVKLWLAWAGHKSSTAAGTGKVSKELVIERDDDGRLMKATVYKS